MLVAGCSSGATDTTTTADEAVTATTTSTVTTIVPVPTTAASPVTIMPMGDSITQGVRSWGTYRCYLDAMLRDAGIPFDFVGTRSETYAGGPYGCPTDFAQDHEGYWGSAIDRLSALATPSVETLQPDVALIHIGTNDLIYGHGPSTTAKDLESFIAGLQAVGPDITILVAQVIPCTEPLPYCSDDLPALNDAIGSFGNLSTNESAVIVVDMETDFDLDDLRDPWHPTDAGDELIAGRWMAALEESGVISTDS